MNSNLLVVYNYLKFESKRLEIFLFFGEDGLSQTSFRWSFWVPEVPWTLKRRKNLKTHHPHLVNSFLIQANVQQSLFSVFIFSSLSFLLRNAPKKFQLMIRWIGTKRKLRVPEWKRNLWEKRLRLLLILLEQDVCKKFCLLNKHFLFF